MSSAGSCWEKTDRTEEVLSGREKQIVCLAQKQTSEKVTRSDPFCGTDQVSGFNYKKAGLGQLMSA